MLAVRLSGLPSFLAYGAEDRASTAVLSVSERRLAVVNGSDAGLQRA
jgi:hypothetical protein